MNIYKRISAFFFMVLFVIGFNSVIAQNNQLSNSDKTFPKSFVIHGKFSDELLNFYTKSIESANFEQYRLKTTPVILKFKNGFLLELLSAKEFVIKQKEVQIDINKYSDNITAQGYKYPLFEILESGWITAGVENTNSK